MTQSADDTTPRVQMIDEGFSSPKWLYLIVDHPIEEKIGTIRIESEEPDTNAGKNRVGKRETTHPDTGETITIREVGLGQREFADIDEFEEQVGDVVITDLCAIDDKHLEAAGFDPARFDRGGSA